MRDIDHRCEDRDGPVEINIRIGRRRPAPPVVVLFTLGPVREQTIIDAGPESETHMTQLSETQFVAGTITPQTRRRNAAQVQAGSSRFTSSDPSVLLVEQDATNEFAVVAKAVAPGAAQLRWTADADLGDGVVVISAVEDFVVVAGPAVGGAFSFGTPQEQVIP